jgi:glycine/D-amino acid oxidase-like deaminating enzyme
MISMGPPPSPILFFCCLSAQVKMLNGPESFTPDNQYILGEAPEVKGFYVAAGFNSSGAIMICW